MTKLDLYWMKREWVEYNGTEFVLKEDAPQEAKESYERYLQQRKDASERGTI